MKRHKTALKRHAWSALNTSIASADVISLPALGIEGLVGRTENPVLTPSLERDAVLADWAAQNAALLEDTGNRKVIYCADEADMSIYRFCQRLASQGLRTVVHSQDSDFTYIPRWQDVSATLRYQKKWAGRKGAVNKPWTLVNLRSLHQYRQFWKWHRSDFARLAAVMMTGHDYFQRGLYNVGLTRLVTSNVMDNVSREYIDVSATLTWSIEYRSLHSPILCSLS
jgi:hypothetical protein